MNADIIQATFDYTELDAETRGVVQQRTSEIKLLMRRAASDIIEIGQKLIEVKDRLGHGKFGAWLEHEFDWSERTAQNFMQVADVFKSATVADLIPPKALYLLAAPSTPEPARIEAIERAKAGEPITFSTARDIVAFHKPVPLPPCNFYCSVCGEGFDTEVWHCPVCIHHWPMEREECWNCNSYTRPEFRNPVRHVPVPTPANFTSTSVEWYTPVEYIEAARQVMQTIDLDPASNTLANNVVQATHYHTIEDNGLLQSWHGHVWLNPPYGTDAGESWASVWANKLIEQYTLGNTTEAILLINAVTDRKWFQVLWQFPICFTDHRIRFYTPEGTPQQPVSGNAFVYLGNNVSAFAEAFSRFGTVVVRYA